MDKDPAHDNEQNAEAGIYRWRGEGPWKRLWGGLPQPLESFPYALLFGGDMLFTGLGDGRIYQSEDRGDGWERMDVRGDAPSRVLAMAWLP